MKQFLRFLGKSFGAGAAAMLGALAIAVSIHGINAATLATYTGVSGSNPINNPSILADANQLIQNINSNAAMATTNTLPSQALGITQASTSGLQTGVGSAPIPMLATMSAVWTTVTSNCSNNVDQSVAVCMGIIDNSGTNFTLHWLKGK